MLACYATSVMSNSLDPIHRSLLSSSTHGIIQAITHEWVASHSLIQGTFLTQGSNLGLLNCRQILYHLSHQGSLIWTALSNKLPNDNLPSNDYTVEVRNRFKGLDLIECLMNYGRRFMTLYRRQGARPSPRKRNAKKQNGCLRRLYI